MPAALAAAALALAAACGRGAPREPDLPKQPDRWVSEVALDDDSQARFVGRTRNLVITSLSRVEDVAAPRAIRVGDEIEGVRVGAIKCAFHWRDASYGGEQYMWRGRWACQAGRSREEVAAAVGDDGEKRHDYIHVSPVSLAAE